MSQETAWRGMSSAGSVRLVAVGDIALVGEYYAKLEFGPGYPFSHVRRVLGSADYVIGNLEGPMTSCGEQLPEKCCLKSHPDYARGLREIGINVVSLGNNHILDYGEQGVSDTLRALETHGITHAGFGANLAEARAPLILEKHGIRLAVLSYCDVVIDSPFYATTQSRGIAPFELEKVFEDIHNVRGIVDHVLLSVHWGHEHYRYPSPRQVRQARHLVRAGADVILGHHPHVLQGVERYENGYIVYSLGNFLFAETDWAFRTRDGRVLPQRLTMPAEWTRSAAVTFVFTPGQVMLEAVTFLGIDSDLRVTIDMEDCRASHLTRISRVSEALWYRLFWFFVVLATEWRWRLKPYLKTLRLSRLRRLRLRHLKVALSTLVYLSALAGSSGKNKNRVCN